MSNHTLEIFDLVAKLVSEGRATIFYHHGRGSKCCVIDDIALEFYEEEEGSFRVRFQCLDFLWVRETSGWEAIRTALAKATAEIEDDDIVYPIKKHMYGLLHRQLLECASKSK